MKFNVTIDDTKQDIELKMKGRHIKKVMKSFSTFSTGTDSESVEKNTAYFTLLREIAEECTGLTTDDFDNMDATDVNKITNEIQKQVVSNIDFLKSSLR